MKRRSMRKSIITILVFLISLTGFADGIKFTANSAPKAGIGQNFQVQFTINTKASDISLGNYDGLKLINGPSISTSQNISIVNGNYTQENKYTYTYIFQASQTGTFTIGGATAIVDGKSYTSNSVNVEIQQSAVQSGGNRRNSRNYDPWANFNNNNANSQPKEITADDLFVRVFVDKTSMYKGESLIATIKIYTKVDLVGFEDLKLPSFDNFYAEEIETPGRINLVRENYNNQAYNVGLIKKYILYPRVSGDLTIEPCIIDCQVRQPAQSNNMMGFFGYYETESKSLKSPEIKINVKQLPQSPDSFSGAVGRFNFKLDQSEDTVLVNDAVTIKISISGSGNFNMIETPKISWPKEFEIYEPIASQNTKVDASGLNGTKTWEYTIIPRYPGIFKLGEINFTYFDTSTKQYKTLSSPSINIAVKKDINDTHFGETSYNYAQKNIDYIGEDDIRFINFNSLNLSKNYIPVVLSSFYSWYFILPFLLFISIVLILRKKIRENANIAKVKQRKAGKTSQKRLKKARKYMRLNQKEAFYKEIIAALWGYCSDKLAIPVSDLTKDRTEIILKEKEIENYTIVKLLEVIDKCEFAHFAPVSAETELTYIYKEAVEVIEDLEQKIKK
ncbi:MAG: BatD family protein [Bacteroidales bacterium]|nr:BatD family protein [Bacteroidales bacterium]